MLNTRHPSSRDTRRIRPRRSNHDLFYPHRPVPSLFLLFLPLFYTSRLVLLKQCSSTQHCYHAAAVRTLIYILLVLSLCTYSPTIHFLSPALCSLSCHPCLPLSMILQTHLLLPFNDARTVYSTVHEFQVLRLRGHSDSHDSDKAAVRCLS
jgi:hypothetical protein